MKNLLFKYKNMVIRQKIIIVFLPIVVLPLLVVVFTSNSIFSVSNIQKTKVNISGESSIIVTRIQSIYNNGETSARVLIKNINNIYHELNTDGTLLFNSVKLRNQLLNEFDFNLRAFKDIESIIFIDAHDNFFVSDNRLENNAKLALQSDMVKLLRQDGIPNNEWFPMQTRNYLVIDEKSPVLTIGKRVVDIDTGQTLGCLILNIKESTISSIFPDASLKGEEGYYIASGEGLIVSTKVGHNLLQPIQNAALRNWLNSGTDGASVNLKLNRESYLLMQKRIPELDWVLYKQMLVHNLNKETYTNSITIFIVGVLCILIALIGSFLLSRHIAKPIILLTKVAKHIREGNLHVTSSIDTMDEVGILAKTFNDMIGTINDLLHKVTAEQKKKREYEFALMQAQIKPHFFYNALDLIFVLCERGKTELAADTTKALADFYRVSLSQGKEIIPIGEELKNAEDYLFIQKTRYSDILECRWDIDEDIKQFPIMKLAIQPLIENAIYHGLKPKLSPGLIRITGFMDNEHIILKVMDNGIGIAAHKLQQIKENLNALSTMKSFGLRSVNERLKLYFGENYGIQIESSLGTGTEITLTIPSKKEGWFHD
ncbi:histidine kinase [Paenibacillus marchantiophytorum]|uniref:Histidine kinase n=1 Tax=Paenibacillus marchantiophytorum TaxID=1619310 RepID=A0ABQ2BTU6_9BACL|nr:sensor histidine kinase [Paenibacillus marchantiophytorum]GGI46625.1 histidine kinase [Paenibacillus marchantiophytorum]